MKTNPSPREAAEAAAWAESDERTIRPGAKAQRGTEETRAATRAMLTEAAADDPESAELLARVAGGRPSLGGTSPAGASPMWKVRAPADLDAAARQRAEAEGRSFSDLVRDAVTSYLNRAS